MYQALYRKYRPKNFDNVVGQNHITTTIKNEISLGRISHAYLFTGSRGTGKTSISKIIAKAVNCPNNKDGNPCCECDICKGIDSGAILDVSEIDAASNNGVDNIRQLREEANFLPSTTKYRVYIIDETHMLSIGAFNALLKIMEEPPEHVIFILATTEVNKVPTTIISRCQRFDFKRIACEDIVKRIDYVCKSEDINIDNEAMELIARISDGGMRDALSIADICRSYEKNITKKTVLKATGMTEENTLFLLADAILEKDVATSVKIINDMHQNSADFKRICTQLLEHYRNLMIAKAAKDLKELVVCTKETENLYKEQANRYKMSQIVYSISVLQEALSQIGRSEISKIAIEMAIIKMSDASLDDSTNAILSRIDKIEDMLRSGSIKINTEKKYVKSIPKEQPQQEIEKTVNIENPKVDLKKVIPFKQWAEVLTKLETLNDALHGTLVNSKAFVFDTTILINANNDIFLDLMRNNAYTKKSLHSAIISVTGKKYRIGPYKEDRYKVEDEIDPLDEFAQNAQNMGVDVNIK